MFGIENYEPIFFDKVEIFKKVLGSQLSKAIGKTIDDYWLMWDSQENRWFQDGPVILKISNRQFEFTANKLDEFSLTFDQIDIGKKLDWYGLDDDLPLIWKNQAKADMNKLIGRKITDISIISYNFSSKVLLDKIHPENKGRINETGFMLHGIEFTFEKKGWFDQNNFLQIFNALDSNGITTQRQKPDKQYHKIKI